MEYEFDLLNHPRRQKPVKYIITKAGCHEITSHCRCSNGYVCLRKEFTNENWMAHRLVWEHFNGAIPEGMCVLHKCDNPACANIDHLFLGSQPDNVRDMIDKGRDVNSPGEKNGRSKLKENQVREIKGLRGLYPQRELARIYGVSRGLIHRIQNGQTWKHVEVLPGEVEKLGTNKQELSARH